MKQIKRYRLVWIPLLLLLVGGVGFDLAARVAPAMPPPREGEPEPPRPGPEEPPYFQTPMAPSFEERRRLYYAWVLEQPSSDERGGVWTDIVKLEAGQAALNPAALQAALDFVNARQDPSDFALTSLIRLYYLNRENGKLAADQAEGIEEAMLNFKYWLDEPGTSYVEMWTENHQILMHSAEYLAGQLFPEQVFGNNGESGRWHMDHARALILQWIEMRARTGFAEWDSETYYPEDLAPLLNLVDFCQDGALATRAAMLVDLILFDTAVDSFYGQFASSHGRVTTGSIKSARSSMTTINALAWGQGQFSSAGNMGAVSLATSRRYRVPAVIQALALDMPEEYLNFERHSFNVDRAAEYGLDLDEVNDAPRFWGMGAFTGPEVIALTIEAADAWELWHYPDFRDLKEIAQFLQKVHGLPLASRLLDPDPNGVLMSEVNKVSYRTPDGMLSSAQSFRPGEKGYQQHIWQATLSPYAVVFGTNPDSLRSDDSHRPSYWMANGRQPRTGQYRNLLIALYKLPRYPSAPPPLEARHFAFTHAYFPTWAFDQVVERDGWLFGRAGEGYVALYSDQPYQWIREGPDADQEIVAPGYQNVWICQIGRAAVDGPFEAFVEAVSAAELSIRGLEVEYQAPGIGAVSLSWEGPLTVAGEPVDLGPYRRFDNPYAQVEFGSLQYLIEHQGLRLALDFEAGTREE